jgi:HEAT repeat protein
MIGGSMKLNWLLLLGVQLIGCCSESDLPSFKKGLYSPAAKERNAAALGLAKCGEKASDSVPRLGHLLYDENVGVQSSAAYALRKIDTETARKLLRRVEEQRAARRENRQE